MTAAIILLLVGFFLVCYGLFRGIALAISMWWLLCQICFHNDLERISYDISIIDRLCIVVPIVSGVIAIVFGFRILP